MPAPQTGIQMTQNRAAQQQQGAGRLLRLAATLLALLLATQFIAYFAQWPWLYWLVAWPSTVLHEGSHWLMAWLLQGTPSQFHVWPDWAALWGQRPSGAGSAFSLGSVQFIPNHYNSASVALAPLLLWPLTAFWLCLAMRPKRWGLRLMWLYVAASSLTSSWPSAPDWQLAWQVPASWPLALLVLASAAWLCWLMLPRLCLRH